MPGTPKNPGHHEPNRALPYLGLALLTCLAYGRAVRFGFFHDDLFLARPLDTWRFLGLSPVGFYWRPLWTLWMSAQYQLFGLHPGAMHAASLALHVLNCWLALSFLLAAGVRRSVAVATVALWTILAGNSYPIVWISACNDLLAMAFLIPASQLILTPAERPPSAARTAVSSLLWLLSVLAKDIALVWPVAAAAILWARAGRAGTRGTSRGATLGRMAMPLVALLLYALLRARAQAAGGGYALTDLPGRGGHLHGYSAAVVVLGRAVHFLEALVYSYLPLDLFRSWVALGLGTLIAIGFASILVAAYRTRRHPLGTPVAFGLGWLVLFSLHGLVIPHPRALYVPTLGLAFLVCTLALGTDLFRRRWAPGLACAAYLGMHIHLGQQSADFHSPDSPATLIHTSQLVLGSDPRITPEMKAYLRSQLRYENVDSLARLTKEENALWRTQLQRTLRKVGGGTAGR